MVSELVAPRLLDHAGYLVFLLAVVAERIYELRVSRRNARALLAQGGEEVGQGHYGVMKAVHTLFLVSCAAEALALDRHPSTWIGGASVVGAVGAQGLRYWAIRTLGGRWSTRVIVLRGAQPVTDGPYRYIAHPNYLAVILEMGCVPLAGGAWITALVFSAANAVLLLVRIRAEEEALGEAWSTHFHHEPRFLPGRRRA